MFALPRFNGLIKTWSDQLVSTLERVLISGDRYGISAAPSGPAGGGLAGNYPNAYATNLRTATAISTAAGATLTAAALVGGVIIRTGPAAGFTDTTDTAANILAQFNIALQIVDQSFDVMIANASGQTMTIQGGTNVTLGGNTGNFVLSTGVTRLFRAIVTAIGTPALTIYG